MSPEGVCAHGTGACEKSPALLGGGAGDDSPALISSPSPAVMRSHNTLISRSFPNTLSVSRRVRIRKGTTALAGVRPAALRSLNRAAFPKS